MDKEEFYNKMDDIAAELYEKYVNDLSEYSDSILLELQEQEYSETSLEVDTYIASRSEELRKRLNREIQDFHEKSSSMKQNHDERNLVISIEKLKLSFKNLYESARGKIKSLIK